MEYGFYESPGLQCVDPSYRPVREPSEGVASMARPQAADLEGSPRADETVLRVERADGLLCVANVTRVLERPHV